MSSEKLSHIGPHVSVLPLGARWDICMYLNLQTNVLYFLLRSSLASLKNCGPFISGNDVSIQKRNSSGGFLNSTLTLVTKSHLSLTIPQNTSQKTWYRSRARRGYALSKAPVMLSARYNPWSFIHPLTLIITISILTFAPSTFLTALVRRGRRMLVLSRLTYTLQIGLAIVS